MRSKIAGPVLLGLGVALLLIGSFASAGGTFLATDRGLKDVPAQAVINCGEVGRVHELIVRGTVRKLAEPPSTPYLYAQIRVATNDSGDWRWSTQVTRVRGPRAREGSFSLSIPAGTIRQAMIDALGSNHRWYAFAVNLYVSDSSGGARWSDPVLVASGVGKLSDFLGSSNSASGTSGPTSACIRLTRTDPWWFRSPLAEQGTEQRLHMDWVHPRRGGFTPASRTLKVVFVDDPTEYDSGFPLQDNGGSFASVEVHLLLNTYPLPADLQGKLEWERSAKHYSATMTSSGQAVSFAIDPSLVGRTVYPLVSVVLPGTESTPPDDPSVLKIEERGKDKVQVGFRPPYAATLCSAEGGGVQSILSISAAGKASLAVVGALMVVLAVYMLRRGNPGLALTFGIAASVAGLLLVLSLSFTGAGAGGLAPRETLTPVVQTNPPPPGAGGGSGGFAPPGASTGAGRRYFEILAAKGSAHLVLHNPFTDVPVYVTTADNLRALAMSAVLIGALTLLYLKVRRR